MKDNEKQIEEMANFIHRTEFVDISRYEEETIAKELLKHYQPKLPEDSVVLTTEELKDMVKARTKCVENAIIRTRKETAEKILVELYNIRDYYGESREYEIRIGEEGLKELAKQFGVEIKE